MKAISIQYYTTAVGELVLGAMDGRLCLCDWRYRKMRDAVDSRIKKTLRADFVEQGDAVIDLAIRQLEAYFLQQRREFDVPLLTAGTPFQNLVWDQLQQIPYGSVASYKQLAENMDKASAVRAVASANGANALSIFIPCHRIIGSNGQLVGYAGGLPAKQKLLALESDLFALS